MDNKTIYTKTAKGLREITGRSGVLSRDLRIVLKEIDGKTAAGDLLFHLDDVSEDELQSVLLKLVDDNYIREFITANEQRAVRQRKIAAGFVEDSLDFTALDFTPEAGPAGASAAAARPESQHDLAARLASAQRAVQETAWREAEERARRAAEELARQEAVARAKREAAEQARRRAEQVARRAAEELARREAEERARRAAEERAKRLADEQARREAAARAQREAEEQAQRRAQQAVRRAAEELARRAAAEQARQAAEELAQQEAAAKARREAEEQARRRQEAAARRAAEEQAKRAAAERARQEAAAKARREAEEQARWQVEAAAMRAAEELAQQEAEAKARREAEEQARREAAAAARLAAEEAARREAEAQAKRAAEEFARQEAEAKAQREAEEQARREAEAAVRRAAEEAARRQAEEAAMREAEERARQEAEAKARREAEEQARREAEAAARRAAEEAARRQAEEAARRAAQERARQEAEAQARREAEELARRQAEEAARRAAEEAVRRAAEEEEARRQAEAEARREAEERARQEAAARAQREADRQERLRAEEEAREAERLARLEAEAASARIAAVAIAADPLGKPRDWVRRGAAALLVLVAAGLGLLHLVPFDAQRARWEQIATAQFQQPVSIRALHFSLLPSPRWQLDGITVGAQAQIKIARITANVAGLAWDSWVGENDAYPDLALDNAVVNGEGLHWLLFGKPQPPQLKLARVDARNIRLVARNIGMPVLGARVIMGTDGRWQKIAVEAAEGKLRMALLPAADGVQFDFNAGTYRLPFESALELEDVYAKGMATPAQLAVSEFTGHLNGGILRGNARLNWASAWTLSGAIDVKQMAVARFAPALAKEGTLEGSATYTLGSKDAAKPLALQRLDGSFSVRNGTLLGVDLGNLLKYGGSGGKTPFSEVVGNVAVDGNGQIQLRQLRLAAGIIAAAGNAAVEPDARLRGQFAVDLKLPVLHKSSALALSGTLKEPRFKRQ